MAHTKRTKNIPYPTGHSEKSSIILSHETCFFNQRSGVVVRSPDSEGLGAAVVAGVDSNLTQPSGISYFSLYTFFSEILACVMILVRKSLLKFV